MTAPLTPQQQLAILEADRPDFREGGCTYDELLQWMLAVGRLKKHLPPTPRRTYPRHHGDAYENAFSADCEEGTGL
jgi:hypothetical protein